MVIRKLRDESEDVSESSESVSAPLIDNIQRINLQPFRDPRSKSNRYVLQFHSESPKELKAMREEARSSLNYATEEELEIGDNFYEGYDIPKRPEWTHEMSKAQLEAKENNYFFVSIGIYYREIFFIDFIFRNT